MNDLTHVKAACLTGQGYSPAWGGLKVQALERAIEGENTSHASSIFASIQVPTLIFAGDSDEAVNSQAVQDICWQNRHFCQTYTLASVDHSLMMTAFKTK